MKPVAIKIVEIYVPAALRKPVDPAKVTALAESIADKGQETPILVRPDKDRYVLVSGLHRIEARLDELNHASAALCSRLGMRLEARHIDKWRYKGQWATELVYAILAAEWRIGAAR